MNIKNGKYYGICECCTEVFEISENDLIHFEGRHHNCDVPHPHVHSRYPIEICNKCAC